MQSPGEYIDDHFDETIGRLMRWVAQPSISAENRGMQEMAMCVAEELIGAGFDAKLIQTAGAPIVLATLGETNKSTVLIYDHYDVQPAGEDDLWSSPPFAPEARDARLYGRGVADNKGNIVARLDALRAILKVRGSLPVNIVWLIEGEEEIGSPNLGHFLREHAGTLVATGCIWEFGGYAWDGTPTVNLGLKGMLSVELTARGAARDLHSSMAAFVQSPVWRLLWALNSIRGCDGRVNIPGFYDDVHVPTPAQAQLLAQIPDDTVADREAIGLGEYIGGISGHEVYHASAFVPTANIQGIVAGYTGPGTKTVLPNEARAKIDFRLVPDQDPEAIFRSLRGFLAELGYEDIGVERIAGEGDLLPANSDPGHDFVQATIQACLEVSGRTPIVIPSAAGSGPMAYFTSPPPVGLGMPVVAIGVGYPDTRTHAPNENIRLEDVRAHMHTVVRLIELLGDAQSE